MTVTGTLAVGVAGGTFALLSRSTVRGVPLSRAVTSAAGAVAVVALGILSPAAALDSLDASTLLLLFGMLCHVEALRRSGCYEWAAAVLVERAATARRLTLGTLALSAALSAVALNDATVLLLTPVLVSATRRADVDPVFPLLAVVLGANVGSLATPMGNPQNAFVLARSGLTTVGFVAVLAPVTLVALLLAALVLLPYTDRTPLSVAVDRPDLDARWAALSAGFVLATLALMTALSAAGPGVVAAAAGIAHVAALQFFRRVPGADILQSVDWGILVMFAGIFVVVGALERSGAASALSGAVSAWSLPLTTFVLSNLVSNVPAVVLLSGAADSAGDWYVLAAVSTLAGNATPVGSAATLVVLDQAHRAGVEIPLRRLLRVGVPVAAVTSLAAVGLLRLLLRVSF